MIGLSLFTIELSSLSAASGREKCSDKEPKIKL